MKKGFTVLAHRGARGHAPENTLLAFARCIEAGAKWIELDVQLHDGELWIFHDLRLERTTNGTGWLMDHGKAALRKLDAGEGQQIPFLGEVIDLVARRAVVNVELKTAAGTAAAVAALLRDYLARGWQARDFLVSSFHLPELRDFHRRLPEVPLLALVGGVPLNLAGDATALGAETAGISAEFVDDAFIADAHARGLKVFVYTVNESDDVQRLKARGVDGVFSDFPERA